MTDVCHQPIFGVFVNYSRQSLDSHRQKVCHSLIINFPLRGRFIDINVIVAVTVGAGFVLSLCD